MKRAIQAEEEGDEEEEEEEEDPSWAIRPMAKGKGKGSKQRKAGTPPRMTPKVPSPTRASQEEEEEEQQALEGEEGEEASVIMGAQEGAAGTSVFPSVVMVGDPQAVRVEQAFEANEKAELDAVAAVMPVMGLFDLVDPPHGLQEVEYLSVERYFSADYFTAIDDFDDGGENARVDLTPLARLDSPEGAAKVASKVRQGGAPKPLRI